MPSKQWQKFVGWIAFLVLMPNLVYPAAGVFAYFAGSSFSLMNALSSGDLLFLVVILQAATVNWTVMAREEIEEKANMVVSDCVSDRA